MTTGHVADDPTLDIQSFMESDGFDWVETEYACPALDFVTTDLDQPMSTHFNRSNENTASRDRYPPVVTPVARQRPARTTPTSAAAAAAPTIDSMSCRSLGDDFDMESNAAHDYARTSTASLDSTDLCILELIDEPLLMDYKPTAKKFVHQEWQIEESIVLGNADTNNNNNNRNDTQTNAHNGNLPTSNHLTKPKKKGPTTKTPPAKAGATKTKKQEDQITSASTISIKDLMSRFGVHNIYFCKGEPNRENPGNKYYRSVIDKYHPEFKNAADNNKRKREIRQEILAEIDNSGRRFYIIEKVKKTAETKGHGEIFKCIEVNDNTKRKAKIGRALLDAPKRFDTYWFWKLDAKNKQRFGPDGATELEEMYHKDTNDQELVEVFIADGKYLVDLLEWEMRNAYDSRIVFEVGREGPGQETDGSTTISVADSDQQMDGSRAREHSSSTGSSNSGNQWDSFAPPNQASSGSFFQSSYNYLGLAGAANHEAFNTDYGMDFTVREATLNEIYDAISLALVESSMKDEGPISTRDTTKAVESADIKLLHGEHLSSSSKATSVSASSEKRRSGIEKLTTHPKNLATLQPGVVRVDHVSMTSDDVIWVWRENRTRMARHDEATVHGDAKDCWIRYDESTMKELEQAFQSQRGTGLYKLPVKYEVDFATMRQTNTSSGYQREVKRIGFKELTVPMMTKTAESVKMNPRRVIEVKGSGVDSLAKKMADVQLHADNDKTTSSLTPSTRNDLRGDDLGSAK